MAAPIASINATSARARAAAPGTAPSSSAGAKAASAAKAAAAEEPRSAAASSAATDAPSPVTGEAPAEKQKAPSSGANAPFDITLEGAADTVGTISQQVIRRAEMFMLAQHLHNQDQQARLDRMRSEFDNAQARRAELLREANALRDMALEQMKHDDEVLKKFISWI